MRYAVFLLAALIALPAFAEDVADRDWSSGAAHSLENYAPPTGDLETFVNKQLDTDWNMHVCSFKFADMGHDGKERLIASLDVNGRRACNRLAVIEKSGSGFRTDNDFQVWEADDVREALRDLDGDRVPELAVQQSWSKYEGERCVAAWLRIYKWKNGSFDDASAGFPDLYRARRKQLETVAAREGDPSCHQMEMDKIDRFLGSPKAGFERAEGWMKSPESSLRRKAAAVFADIGDDSAKKNLSILAKDDDPLTAESARLYLESKN